MSLTLRGGSTLLKSRITRIGTLWPLPPSNKRLLGVSTLSTLSAGNEHNEVIGDTDSSKTRVVILGTGWGGFNLAKEMTEKPGWFGRLLGRKDPNPNVHVTGEKKARRY